MAGATRRVGFGLISSILLACGALTPLPGTTQQASAAPAAAIQPQAPTLEEFKATLSSYGQFIYSERYGNVWKPSVVPAGWHPYPACHWVYDRLYGWTYDDPTTWGKIIHHYGRWASDGGNGWVWIPGAQWSPAWVIWRGGGDWTGWAPTPPAADQQEISLANFNEDRQWIFIETAKLANRCNDEPAAVPTAVFAASKPVTTFKIVRGIAVFVLPPPVIIIDYDTGPVAPWSAEFLGEWLLWLNTAAASASLNLGAIAASSCPPPAPAAAPKPLPVVLPAPAAPRIKPWQPPAPRSIRRRETQPAYTPEIPHRQRVATDPGPDYVAEPPIYVAPPRLPRPPIWSDGPVIRRPHRYPPSGPVVTPSNESTTHYPYPRYPRRRRPSPYGEQQAW